MGEPSESGPWVLAESGLWLRESPRTVGVGGGWLALDFDATEWSRFARARPSTDTIDMRQGADGVYEAVPERSPRYVVAQYGNAVYWVDDATAEEDTAE